MKSPTATTEASRPRDRAQNCLDNGEPDERSLHEGVAPTRGIKYAINGWVRSKNLYSNSNRFGSARFA